MISHYATRGRRLPLLAVLEEATSESSTRVLVFILTALMTDPRSNGVGFTSYFATLDQGSVPVQWLSSRTGNNLLD